jgi:lysophospholipase L1-like esterase
MVGGNKPFTKDEMAEFSVREGPLFRKTLVEMRDICKSYNITPIFITQLWSPVSEYKYDNNIEKLTKLNGMNYVTYGQYLRSRIAKEPLDFIEAVNYVHHDFTDIMRQVSDGRVIDFVKLLGNRWDDLLLSYVHLTPEGNKLLANFIADYISERYGGVTTNN